MPSNYAQALYISMLCVMMHVCVVYLVTANNGYHVAPRPGHLLPVSDMLTDNVIAHFRWYENVFIRENAI